VSLQSTWRAFADRDRALALGGLIMAAGLVASAVIAPFDTRLILGINPWIKPMKFFSSIAIFLWTMAWFTADADRRFASRLTVIRWTMLMTLAGEIALIVMQSIRGTTSHFNDSTPFDGAVFGVMGVLIVANTIAVAAFATTLQEDTAGRRAAYLWGVRLGIVLFVVSSLEGFLMVANSAHSVPGPDGGPGLPFVNWSTRVGDLRVAHFLGLHALQALPLVGYLLDRGWAARPARRRHAVLAAAVVWLGAWSVTLILALAGRPLVAN
jgi:hypothetical protein